MMAGKVALITVASGERYVRYAHQMVASARDFFLCDAGAEPTFLILEGPNGWPAATIQRYHVIGEEADRLGEEVTHIFHIDADMRFVAPVGSEILAPLTATAHPGYVGLRGTYEERQESAAYVGPGEGGIYCCGGFVGGERAEFLRLAESIRAGVDADARRHLTAVWHDESHLNRYLIDRPPDVMLPPSYCYPEDDRHYIQRIWPDRYEPKIVALRKPLPLQWRHRLTPLRRLSSPQ